MNELNPKTILIVVIVALLSINVFFVGKRLMNTNDENEMIIDPSPFYGESMAFTRPFVTAPLKTPETGQYGGGIYYGSHTNHVASQDYDSWSTNWEDSRE